jgi:hypothetical protein
MVKIPSKGITEDISYSKIQIETKAPVIVPMVAAALAGGSRPTRDIADKPQSEQMFQILASKLRVFLDRQVYHTPFYYALRLGEAEANTIGSTCRE